MADYLAATCENTECDAYGIRQVPLPAVPYLEAGLACNVCGEPYRLEELEEGASE